MALTQATHDIVRLHFAGKPTRLAVDATCGNGFDTEFLIGLGFDQVIAFDVQPQALHASQQRIGARYAQRANFILDGHQNLNQHLAHPVDCFMFNLGYLPGADKQLTTNGATTIEALEQALAILADSGLIALVCYPGHPAGALEKQMLVEWFDTIGDTWQIDTHLASAPKPSAPILFTIVKQNSSK